MSDLVNLVGERIRLIRKEINLTQEELAERAGLQNSYIGSVERGERNISIETLEKITHALDILPVDLFRIENSTHYNELATKKQLIEGFNYILSTRTEEEIKALQKITKNVIDVIDLKST